MVPKRLISCPEQWAQHRSQLERRGGRAMAPESQGCPSPLPLGPPASPLLLSCPQHPGLGIQPPLPGQKQSLGALPQEMRPHGKQGTPRTVGLVDPDVLSPLHLKHFLISNTLNASPDVSSDLLLLSSRQKNSLLSLFLPFWLCNIPIVTG